MSRAMDTVTQELIETLTDLLRSHPAAALHSLKVGAPALIDSLEDVKLRAVDRREISTMLRAQIGEWLRVFPQPAIAEQALLGLPDQLNLPMVMMGERKPSGRPA